MRAEGQLYTAGENAADAAYVPGGVATDKVQRSPVEKLTESSEPENKSLLQFTAGHFATREKDDQLTKDAKHEFTQEKPSPHAQIWRSHDIRQLTVVLFLVYLSFKR